MFRSNRPVYKQGKLSRSRRKPMPKKEKRTIIIVVSCILATFIFAIILGNILGGKAQASKRSYLEGEKSKAGLAISINAGNVPDIKAYSVDLTGATPSESLRNQTDAAREKGNAIFMPIKNSAGNIVYTSSMTDELGYSSYDNLTIDRVNSHFTTAPADYVCAYWKSDFGKNTNPIALVEEKTREAKLLSELSINGASEILVSFSDRVTEDNILNYQTYLLTLQMAAPDVHIGVVFDINLFAGESSSYIISELMKACDFCAIDLTGSYETNEQLESKLKECVYVTAKYPCRMLLSYKNDEFFEGSLKVLDKLKIDSFVAFDFDSFN